MTKSRQELVERALRKLGVVAAGQTPAAEDAAIVDDEIVPVLSDLAKREVYAFGDPDAIEDEAFVHLASILANSVAADFGKPEDEQGRLYAEQRLRHLRVVDLSGQRQVTEYF